jgi:hypothetical protein
MRSIGKGLKGPCPNNLEMVGKLIKRFEGRDI